ncbi:hypothetical protein [Enterococcus sp. DIV0840c]|uniref:hypothetical protein n=1 Tax=Enterococcus sp. DIV0840c TaxID=2774772 RepID=UPI003D2E925B
MEMFVGRLDKIRVINPDPMLVRFTVALPNLNVNCVTATIDIANKLLMLPDNRYDCKVTGRFNKRNQLVLRQIEIINPDQMIKELGI